MENNIKKIREQKGIKQIDMADSLKISHTYLSRIENGKVDFPITLAVRIARFLDCSLDEIFLS